MFKLQLISLSLGWVLLSTWSGAQAEVFSIAEPSYQTPNSEAGVLRPTQGMNMVQVERQFGQPKDIRNAIGEPPITRWTYLQFDVFFEHNQVIHSVVKRPE